MQVAVAILVLWSIRASILEFLAIVHALALIKKNGWDMKVYSDSISGMAWVRNKKAKTTLKRDEQTAQVLDLVIRAENWLWANPKHAEVLKWNTEEWGEIPADFGRKASPKSSPKGKDLKM